MAWKRDRSADSFAEAFSSVRVPEGAGAWRRFLSFVGPGMLVAVGYMDPGNWATDIEGGAKFGYQLLFVILLSNCFAILLQYLAIKLGVVGERDLAQACRDSYSKPVNFILWLLAEVAIAATDLAEVIGTAIALNLLFGLPLLWGVAVTILDVFLILLLQKHGFRWIESFVAGLIGLILFCFIYELVLSHPEVSEVMGGLVPSREIVKNPQMLFLAVGILGATVMPHNLYLHSSLVQTRGYQRNEKGKKEALKFAGIDSTASLLLAFFINASILIVAAASFHGTPYSNLASIQDAYKMLAPLLGTSLASIAFGVALLASGQNSTLTGTLAGQIIMEGFLNIRLKPWLRRLITRLIAVVPAFFVTLFYGETGTEKLLILSQVILSMQLAFAVIPLIQFTGNKEKMGIFVNSPLTKVLAWSIALVIISLNAWMLTQFFLE